MSDRIRVLVVDDSAFARKVVREVLDADPRVEVVGIARDGLDAIERIAELSPDVVTLDLMMPALDGLGVLDAFRGKAHPRFVVVSMAAQQSDLALAALDAGAIDLVEKPTALATDRLYELGDELVRKVVAASTARAPRAWPSAAGRPKQPGSPRHRVLVVGTSTGGPQALTQLMRDLPADYPIPIAVTVHMPVGYTASLAQRLDGLSRLTVEEAREGLELRPGLVVIARAGVHLALAGLSPLVARLETEPAGHLHRPAVDVLFASAAAAGGPVLAAVLTGMGDDGTAGARAVRAAGGTVVTESARTCVVYGMPRSVVEAGLSDESVGLDFLVEALVRLA